MAPSATGLFDGLRRVIDSIEASTQSALARPPGAPPFGQPGEPGQAGCSCGGGDCGCGCGRGSGKRGDQHNCGCSGDCGCGDGCGCGHHGDRPKDCGCGDGCGCGHHGDRPKDCGCTDPCAEDSCTCTCCVADADLVVYARLGEQRVVPITVVNERRRARDIELDLSEFRTAGGRKAPASGAVLPAAMSLAPCEEEQAIVTIDLTSSFDGGDNDGEGRVRDVDDCTTAYADLRLTGCDTRPVRIAVVILPRVCNVYRVRCGLGCC